jgi:4-alpha-glucanotransferase
MEVEPKSMPPGARGLRRPSTLDLRSAGVLLHLTSLPSAYCVGDLGPEAYRFAAWAARAGLRHWQVLPLTPTDPALGNSPYSSSSTFAGNPLLVSPELLVRQGLVRLADIVAAAPADRCRVDYAQATRFKAELLERAFQEAKPSLGSDPDYAAFVAEHGPLWLNNYALFTAAKRRQGGRPWTEWPKTLRDREPGALAELAESAAEDVERTRFAQHLFFSQWTALRSCLAGLGLSVMGDLPIYPTLDSADVWEHARLFKLDEEKRQTRVAGVPPDYFSATGQRWGNPVYRWEMLAEEGFAWWIRRLAHNLTLYDVVRLDHFRAFAKAWEIPAEEETAVRGEWVDVPGEALFKAAHKAFPSLPFVAEDLGLITTDVHELRDTFGLPGMAVLMFGMGPDVGESTNAMHNHRQNQVAYTGTHDNNTARGWFEQELSPMDRQRLSTYLGHEATPGCAARDLTRLCMLSPARTAMVPMQDLLGLGAGARMNVPSSSRDNWSWRMAPEAATPALAEEVAALCALTGRVPPRPAGQVPEEV